MTTASTGQIVRETLDQTSAAALSVVVARETLAQFPTTQPTHFTGVLRETLEQTAATLHSAQPVREVLRTPDPVKVVIGDLTCVEYVQETGADVSLRWSDTGGASWNNALMQSLGAPGAYKTDIQFRRLGLSRSRIYELSWSDRTGCITLTGAFVDTVILGS